MLIYNRPVTELIAERLPWSVTISFAALIVGTAGTAFLIRTIRANLLDELNKQDAVVARSKGLSEQKMVYKYPFRIAINPAISTLGWTRRHRRC